MIKYICLRCDYESKLKNNFVRHIQRKKICKLINEDVTQNYIYEYYFGNQKICKPKLTECNQNVVKNNQKSNQNVIKSNHNVIKSNHNIKTELCKFCNKEFSNRQNRWRHEKLYCKKKDNQEYNNLLELVKLLNKQLKEKDKQINQKDTQIDELIKKEGITITYKIT